MHAACDWSITVFASDWANTVMTSPHCIRNHDLHSEENLRFDDKYNKGYFHVLFSFSPCYFIENRYRFLRACNMM